MMLLFTYLRSIETRDLKDRILTYRQDQGTWKAIFYMLLSIVAFLFMHSFVKYLESVSPYQIVFFRALTTLILCLVLLKVRGISLGREHGVLLVSRGIVGTVSMLLFFMAVKEIPFGSAVSLRYLSPIFAAILAVAWLKEHITLWQWICFLMAFSGVLLLKGFDGRITPIGLLYILSSAFFSGLVYVLIRKIGQREHPLVIITVFMFCATLIGAILSLFHWQTPRTEDWWILGSLGIFGFFGQWFMTKAYQIAAVGTIAPIKYFESVLALLIGWIWFEETYGLWSLLGILLIIGGMILNVLARQKNGRR